jgi:hypothetical protein
MEKPSDPVINEAEEIEIILYEIKELMSKNKQLKLDTENHFKELDNLDKKSLDNVLFNLQMQERDSKNQSTASMVIGLATQFFEGFTSEQDSSLLRGMLYDQELLDCLCEEIDLLNIDINYKYLKIAALIYKHIKPIAGSLINGVIKKVIETGNPPKRNNGLKPTTDISPTQNNDMGKIK